MADQAPPRVRLGQSTTPEHARDVAVQAGRVWPGAPFTEDPATGVAAPRRRTKALLIAIVLNLALGAVVAGWYLAQQAS